MPARVEAEPARPPEQPAPAAPPGAARVRDPERGREPAAYAVAILISWLAGVAALGAFGHLSTVPLTYSGDGAWSLVSIRGLMENGQPFTNPRLGAPGIYQTYDFPTADGLLLLEQWLLTRLTDNWVLAFNLFVLLGYPLVAAASVWVMRRLGLSRSASVVFSVLYALLPFHQSRAPGHTHLSVYVAVPLAVALVLELGFSRNRGDRTPARRELLGVPRWAWVAAVIVGAGGVYYAYFGLVLLALAALLTALTTGRWRALVPACAVAAAIVAVVVLQQLPSAAFWRESGPNNWAALRHPVESDLYALRMTELLLPASGHRVPALARMKDAYVSSLGIITPKFLSIASDSSLGLAGVLGFVALLLWLLRSPLRAPPGEPAGVPSRLAIVAAGAFLLGTVGGVGEVIAYSGFPQIRAYDRISVYIAFVSLCAAAWLSDLVVQPLALRGASRAVAVALWHGAVLTVGVLDQTTPAGRPPYEAIRAELENEREFVSRLEAVVAPGAAVYQLPFVPFPESAPVVGTGGYDPLRLYLHSRTLRWSAGAFTGRGAADWQGFVSGLTGGAMIEQVRLVGFRALVIDRLGYLDRAAALEAQLSAALPGAPAVRSRDGRYVAYAL